MINDYENIRPMLNEIDCIISGKVQGVLYRDYVRRKARALRLFGIVENLPDGTVHVFAQGAESGLKKLIEDLHVGSIFSKVSEVKVLWSKGDPKYIDFTIKRISFFK